MCRRAPILFIVLLTLAAGCGGHDNSDNPPPLPDLTVPRETAPPPVTETAPQTDTAPAETTPPPATVPETQTAPDSPENDTAPPSDTPAQRFEQFCNENPGACG